MLTVLDLAYMARDVYYSDNQTRARAKVDGTTVFVPAHVHRVDNGPRHASTGFAAAVYRAYGRLVVTFRGSGAPFADNDDWAHNASMHSMAASQFQPAIVFAVKALVANRAEPGQVIFCGHSLGGGLAQYVSHMLTRQNKPPHVTVVFNAPGLVANTLHRTGLDVASMVLESTPTWLGLDAPTRPRKDLPHTGGMSGPIHHVDVKGDVVSARAIAGPTGRVHLLDPAKLDRRGTSGDAAKVSDAPSDATMRAALGRDHVADDAAGGVAHNHYCHKMDTVIACLRSSPLGRKAPEAL